MRFLLRLFLLFVLILLLLRLVARIVAGAGRKQVGDWRKPAKPSEPSSLSDDIRDAKFKDIPE
ncbi:MAG: hypothetical protein V1784_05485 [bacterium]